MEQLDPYLSPTEFIESDSPAIVSLARSLAAQTPTRTAIALFDWVRDHIRYDPYTAMDPPEQYKATAVLSRGSGHEGPVNLSGPGDRRRAARWGRSPGTLTGGGVRGGKQNGRRAAVLGAGHLFRAVCYGSPVVISVG
ncbi:MAG: hypothetical protein JW797_20660 [Bradymonadales bacterium]|nr:hypothetical protein [Bradymonadales bacterium]